MLNIFYLIFFLSIQSRSNSACPRSFPCTVKKEIKSSGGSVIIHEYQ